MLRGVIDRIVVVTVSLWMWPAVAEPLVITDVAAPAINCVFNTTCMITGTDSTGALAIPGVSGDAFVQSRTFAGALGTPAADMTGYEFRVSLTGATATANNVCITGLKLGRGALSKLPYPGGLGPGEVFVISTGGLGTVGLASAEQSDDAIRFTFWSPVCPRTASTGGQTTYFFGFASAKPPRAITAQVQLDNGKFIDVAARAPAP